MGNSDQTTIRQALASARAQLESAGCPDAELDAELLLAHTLDWTRTRLITYPERELDSTDEARYSDLVALRACRKPLAQILGHWEFYGIEFEIDEHVLIPRPETELLVDLALEQLSTLAEAPTVIDVGTGSGAIAIALATSLPNASVVAIDRSEEALRIARRNCVRNGVQDRVMLVHGDLLNGIEAQADLIAANLPYIRCDELAALQQEVGRFEPAMALDGGPDGLRLIERLLEQAPRRLADGGAILLEIGAEQGAAAHEVATHAFPDASVTLRQDYAGLDRLIVIETARE
jgi:release factor glutamine methyltransferase